MQNWQNGLILSSHREVHEHNQIDLWLQQHNNNNNGISAINGKPLKHVEHVTNSPYLHTRTHLPRNNYLNTNANAHVHIYSLNIVIVF